jgi:hypothetical protein
MMRALQLYATDLIAYVAVTWWALILIRVFGQGGCGCGLEFVSESDSGSSAFVDSVLISNLTSCGMRPRPRELILPQRNTTALEWNLAMSTQECCITRNIIHSELNCIHR